jgi:hypothetical protein
MFRRPVFDSTMPQRPGDSDLDFDLNAEDPLGDPDDGDPTLVDPTHIDATGELRKALSNVPLSDSHVLGGAMIPHWSDGTTDVLVRGRDQAAPTPPAPEPVPEKTEPMFPRQYASNIGVSGDDETVELPRVDPAPASHDAQAQAATVPMPIPPSEPPRSSTSPAPGSGSRLLIVLLISYASAVTLALIYLLATRGLAPSLQHQLENLRDPADEEGTVRIIERGADLPPGHTLRLAEGRRFGNILVEPLRLTRGPLEFVHFSGDPRNKQPPSAPVFKLWLRLTNHSEDQSIAPFDALLLYKRAINQSGTEVANNFLCRQADRVDGPVVFAYPTSQHSEWDMRGQYLGRVLQPGESLETFIPSDPEGLDGLTGELLWRFQMRKGYADTGRGVTTLVDVLFDSDDVVEEQPSEPTAKESKPRRDKSAPPA